MTRNKQALAAARAAETKGWERAGCRRPHRDRLVCYSYNTWSRGEALARAARLVEYRLVIVAIPLLPSLLAASRLTAAATVVIIWPY